MSLNFKAPLAALTFPGKLQGGAADVMTIFMPQTVLAVLVYNKSMP